MLSVLEIEMCLKLKYECFAQMCHLGTQYMMLPGQRSNIEVVLQLKAVIYDALSL